MRHRRGFTLVELLVVIGIIALLISILMPSLSRARSSANLVACQSNFRQVYTALSFYANENKGFLPYASRIRADGGDHYDAADSPDGGNSGLNSHTFIELSRLLGTQINDVYKDPLNKVFVCVEADLNAPVMWCAPMIRTIQFHPRAMPGYDQIWDDVSNKTHNWPQRRLSSIRNSAEKMAFWEGPQLPTWNATCEPRFGVLEGWRVSYGHRFREEIPPTESNNYWDNNRRNEPADIGANRDDGWDVCGMRFRHMRNTMGPIAFWDGHVEARKCTKDATGKDIPDVRVEELRIVE